MTKTFSLGPTGHVTAVAPGIEIHERIARWAYPQNGNAHNPTPQKVWDVFVHGKRYLVGLKLREAKAEAKLIRREANIEARGV